ncbi:MAG: hypothetical protein M1832_001192 [Thelocarpon impressellum]|nr:MAG: hypothetical protein M1832_001192 [Thelocarpon impressellum]
MSVLTESDACSDSGLSRSNSITSSGHAVPESSRLSNRPKTSFHLAQPPPAIIHRQRLHIRPKLLLQLQRLSSTARPSPTFDVLPSTLFAPRLARRFPKLFTGKDGLGPNDLVVVGSEGYRPAQAAAADGHVHADLEADEDRHVIATICQPRKEDVAGHGRAEMRMSEGRVWEASSLSTGGYQLVAADAHGLKTTARWVRRPAGRPRGSTAAPGEQDRRFSFSIIDPRSRRHPIIATMTRSTIEILDTYPSSWPPDGSSPPPTPFGSLPESAGARHSSVSAAEPGERLLVPTDESLRDLILVSGIWVAFREGWSQNFRYHDGPNGHATAPASGSLAANGRRSASAPLQSKGGQQRATSVDGPSRPSPPPSMSGRLVRTGSHLLHLSETPEPPPSKAGDAPVPATKRANSTGTSVAQLASDRSASLGGRPSAVFGGPMLHEEEGSSGDEVSAVQHAAAARAGRPTTPKPASLPMRSNGNGASHKDDDRGRGVALGNQVQPDGRRKTKWGRLRNLLVLSRHSGGAH